MHTDSTERWAHSHSFGQERRRKGETRTLAVTGITAGMMVIEIAAGLAFGSMALLADGLHMASHATALGIATLGYYFTRRHAHDPRFNFGTGKLNSLAAFASAVILAVVAAMMAWQSFARIMTPGSIDYDKALPVAAIGLAVNIISLFILGVEHEHSDEEAEHHKAHEHDHNLLAAYLHVLADAATSVLAIVALFAGKKYGAAWLDPVMGLVGAGLVTHWAAGLIKTSGAVLLDMQAPQTLRTRIREVIERESDSRLTDLHVWSVGPAVYAASISVVSSDPKTADHYRNLLPGNLGLAHTTVEVHRCPDSHQGQ
ncbi:MAG: CDF family Co(II)/Ni(II) efflux transporter DmeF [Elusimicrobia bacterium]|nr:CDF family Co(II)/Ni(II) efflux transporter DmeF [Elusimicrobiota bacterium]